ncbi:MAG: cob(I)yrinic acid a,c-diamide adenosyltransferase [Deltaproteobacteria bacterium]|nr:cob(I)yrinic acid a,c-diamide adenosyltransferase [Deltaproteobacteria bacterium]
MVRINKVYTKVGDKGTTMLVGGDRVPKDSLRIEAYGTVDELNAVLGLCRTVLARSKAGPKLSSIVARVQNELFNLGSELATPDEVRRARQPAVAERHVLALEKEIDELNEELPELRSFILPGGGEASSFFHLARTTCRRAERRIVSLARAEGVGEMSIKYMNRLSDALFVFGRWASRMDAEPEPLWEPEKT